MKIKEFNDKIKESIFLVRKHHWKIHSIRVVLKKDKQYIKVEGKDE